MKRTPFNCGYIKKMERYIGAPDIVNNTCIGYQKSEIDDEPCVSEQACREDKMKVLDKIRERIEFEKLGYTQSSGYYKAIIKCLQIIDKYIAESEDDVIKRKAGTPREDYMPLYNCENWIP